MRTALNSDFTALHTLFQPYALVSTVQTLEQTRGKASFLQYSSNTNVTEILSVQQYIQPVCNGNPVGVRGQRGDRKIQGRQKMCRDRGSNPGLRI